MGLSPNKTHDSIGYQEKDRSLSVRINAHKNFSNFSLEDWMKKNLPFRAGDHIFDIGCGNGNLFPVYAELLGPHGSVTGMDQSTELLAKAGKIKVNTQISLFQGSMDDNFPNNDATFDYVISTFAIYYVEKIDKLMGEVFRILKPEGRFLFLGPTEKNASELYAFNELLYGIGMDEMTLKRSNRIEHEFIPVAWSYFSDVSFQRIQRKIVFPNKDAFLEYYLATLLYEESAKKRGHTHTMDSLQEYQLNSLEISKEMIWLTGGK